MKLYNCPNMIIIICFNIYDRDSIIRFLALISCLSHTYESSDSLVFFDPKQDKVLFIPLVLFQYILRNCKKAIYISKPRCMQVHLNQLEEKDLEKVIYTQCKSQLLPLS